MENKTKKSIQIKIELIIKFYLNHRQYIDVDFAYEEILSVIDEFQFYKSYAYKYHKKLNNENSKYKKIKIDFLRVLLKCIEKSFIKNFDYNIFSILIKKMLYYDFKKIISFNDDLEILKYKKNLINNFSNSQYSSFPSFLELAYMLPVFHDSKEYILILFKKQCILYNLSSAYSLIEKNKIPKFIINYDNVLYALKNLNYSDFGDTYILEKHAFILQFSENITKEQYFKLFDIMEHLIDSNKGHIRKIELFIAKLPILDKSLFGKLFISLNDFIECKNVLYNFLKKYNMVIDESVGCNIYSLFLEDSKFINSYDELLNNFNLFSNDYLNFKNYYGYKYYKKYDFIQCFLGLKGANNE